MKKIALFASGSGTNVENLITYFQGHSLVNIALVVSNRPDAYVLERSSRLGVPSVVFLKDDWQTGDKITACLSENEIDFIVLAGFLMRIPDMLLHNYPDKIINIHPSLLPKYGGKGMYGNNVHEAVINAREKESGITIHYINKVYDAGEIIFQKKCAVEVNDSPSDLAKKVHALEYECYPRIIEQIVGKSS